MLIGIIIVLFISVLLGIKLSLKISGSKDKSYLFTGFIILLFTCLNLLIFGLSQAIFEEHFKFFFKSVSYEATVVGEKGISEKNSFKNSYSEHPVYAAIVEFKDKNGYLVRIETNEYSAARPIIGSKRKIAYFGNDNDTYASDLSLTSSILLFLGLFFIGSLVVVSYLMASYAFGINKQDRKKLAKTIFVIFVFLDICIVLGRIFIIESKFQH